ncbi:hypothetical protein MTO96_033263 [Rhipicephalus appendiculatus]
MKMVIRKVKVPQTRMKREAEKVVQKHRQANLPLKRLPNQWPRHLDLIASDAKSPTKGADAKGQAGGKVAEKGRPEQGMRKGGQKDKGWCTVCEIHFDGSFLEP